MRTQGLTLLLPRFDFAPSDPVKVSKFSGFVANYYISLHVPQIRYYAVWPNLSSKDPQCQKFPFVIPARLSVRQLSDATGRQLSDAIGRQLTDAIGRQLADAIRKTTV